MHIMMVLLVRLLVHSVIASSDDMANAEQPNLRQPKEGLAATGLVEFFDQMTSPSTSLRMEIDLSHSVFHKSLSDKFEMISGTPSGHVVESHGPWDILYLEGTSKTQYLTDHNFDQKNNAIHIHRSNDENDHNSEATSSSSDASLLEEILREGIRTNQKTPQSLTCADPTNPWIDQRNFGTFQLTKSSSTMACSLHSLQSAFADSSVVDRVGSSNRVVFHGAQAVMGIIALSSDDDISNNETMNKEPYYYYDDYYPSSSSSSSSSSWKCSYMTMVTGAHLLGNRAIYTEHISDEDYPSFYMPSQLINLNGTLDNYEAMDKCAQEALTTALLPNFPWCSMAYHSSYFLEAGDTSTANANTADGGAASGCLTNNDEDDPTAIVNFLVAAGRRQGNGPCFLEPKISQKSFENGTLNQYELKDPKFAKEYKSLFYELPVPRLLDVVFDEVGKGTEKQFEDQFNNLNVITLVTAISVLAVGVIMEIALALTHYWDLKSLKQKHDYYHYGDPSSHHNDHHHNHHHHCHRQTSKSSFVSSMMMIQSTNDGMVKKLKMKQWRAFLLWVLAIIEFIAGSVPTFYIFVQNGPPGSLTYSDPYVEEMLGRSFPSLSIDKDGPTESYHPLMTNNSTNTEFLYVMYGNAVGIEVVETGVPSWFYISTIFLLVFWVMTQLIHFIMFLRLCIHQRKNLLPTTAQTYHDDETPPLIPKTVEHEKDDAKNTSEHAKVVPPPCFDENVTNNENDKLEE